MDGQIIDSWIDWHLSGTHIYFVENWQREIWSLLLDNRNQSNKVWRIYYDIRRVFGRIYYRIRSDIILGNSWPLWYTVTPILSPPMGATTIAIINSGQYDPLLRIVQPSWANIWLFWRYTIKTNKWLRLIWTSHLPCIYWALRSSSVFRLFAN